MTTRLDHVAILLPEIADGTSFWVDALGLPLEKIEEIPEQQVKIAFLSAGDSHIELIEPTDDTSGVANYLQERGPSLHHICLEVDDIEETISLLKKAGTALIDDEPKIDKNGKKLAFIHPKGTGGVLVELYQYPDLKQDV